MILSELLHRWNRVLCTIRHLILIQTKALQNNKIFSLELLFHGSFFCWVVDYALPVS